MAKAKAKAAAAPAAQTKDEVETLIARMGEISRELTRQEADLGDKVAKAKADAEKLALPLKEEFDEAQGRIQGFCEANRAVLTGGKTKTVKFTTGAISWRDRPPSVRVRGKVEDVIGWMRENLKAKANAFLRVKVELNKEALSGKPDVVAQIPGLTLASAGEDFIIEPFAAELVERAA